MAKEGEDPQCVGGPPVGFVAVEDDGVVLADTQAAHQAGEVLSVDEVADVGVEEVFVPVEAERAGDVADVVEEAVFVAFEDAEPWVVEVFSEPFGGDEALWVRVVVEPRVVIVGRGHAVLLGREVVGCEVAGRKVVFICDSSFSGDALLNEWNTVTHLLAAGCGVGDGVRGACTGERRHGGCPGVGTRGGACFAACQLEAFQHADLGIGGHVEEAMAGEADDDGWAAAGGTLVLAGFQECAGECVGGLGGGHDAFGAGEQATGFEGGFLRECHGVHEAQVVGVGHHGSHAMVPEATGVDGVRYEVCTHGVHLHEWGGLGDVTEVVAEFAFCHGGAGGGFYGNNFGGAVAGDNFPDEGEGEAGQVGAATSAAEDVVGLFFSELLELEEGFFTDDGLVEHYVVEHGAQGVVGFLVAEGYFDGFGDGHAEGSGGARELFVHGAAGFGVHGGGAVAASSVEVHEHAAVGLGFVGGADLPHLNVNVEHGARVAEGGSPLTSTRLGGEVLDAFDLVVVGLRQSGVGLVRADGAHTFVLVVDAGRSAKCLF